DDGEIGTGTFGSPDSPCFTRCGRGGDIDLTVGTMTLQGGSFFSSSTGTAGNAGSIRIKAKKAISISSDSVVGAFSVDTGNAGDIVAEAKSVTVTGGALRSDTLGPGNGGAVRVTASELVSISGTGSGLFSTASGTGNAGQITVAGPGSTS